jgi:hypothetical protein
VPILRRIIDGLQQLRSRHRRRLPFLTPPVDLRRLAPLREDAARRYHQLLAYELSGLREVVAALETTAGGRDLHDCLEETHGEIERLEIELAWCSEQLARWPTGAPA